jgi:hypothetical protein
MRKAMRNYQLIPSMESPSTTGSGGAMGIQIVDLALSHSSLQ